MQVFSKRQDIMTFNTGFVDPVLTYKGRHLSSRDRLKFMGKATISKRTDLEKVKTLFHKDNNIIRRMYAKKPLTVGSNDYYPMTNYDAFNMDNKYNGNDKNDAIIAAGTYEDPLKINPTAMVNMNNYRFVYKSHLKSLVDLGRKDEKDAPIEVAYSNLNVAMSLFNPLYMVNVKGISANVPLMNGVDMGPYQAPMSPVTNLSDCSIRELVSLSHQDNSILGQARYKYADFMYCKDLGKISNNHLITLRVFPYPVGDHIFELTTPKFYSSNYSFSQVGDVGRLVTWFGTEDNKLEDILTYDYHATWKPLEAKIDEIESREDSQERGPLGMLINTFSADYNKHMNFGSAGANSLWKYLGQGAGTTDNKAVLYNYDKNKVYEPKNTIQNTHTYEGKLEFNHEFTLKFCYKLRAYDNINAKSAFLDLLGNIMAVTYRRGKFWGGSRKFIGPTHNATAWNKANHMIDGAFDKIGGVFQGLLNNNFSFESLLGCISGFGDLIKSLIGQGKDIVENMAAGKDGQAPKNAGQALNNIIQKYGLGNALKGVLRNKIGRPALYAMDSLLTGNDVGLWHVTIGNPKNPIASIGNLILEKASVQHSGPLGIDDFPTDITVTVTLKHARGRDAVEIGRMYTKGLGGIYLLPQLTKNIGDYYDFMGGSTPRKGAPIDGKTREVDEVSYDENNEEHHNIEVQPDMGNPEEEAMGLMEYANNPANKIDYFGASKNVLISGTAANYEWHGQTMYSMAKRVLDEIR